MASRLSCDPAKLLATLKATVFKGATEEELMALVLVANEYDLNPLLKEIYAFPAKGGGITPIISVDGWNKMLTRQPTFDGIEFEFTNNEDGTPYSCTVIIFIKDRSRPVKVTEYFAECRRNTDPWNNMPRRMLRNRTLCQGARMAFGFSGVYHEEEAESIVIDATPLPAALPAPPASHVTPQQELEAAVLGAGLDFGLFAKWLKDSGNLQDADSCPSFAEVPGELANRLIKNKTGLIKQLTAMKGAA